MADKAMDLRQQFFRSTGHSGNLKLLLTPFKQWQKAKAKAAAKKAADRG
jgi:hypothetical protein